MWWWYLIPILWFLVMALISYRSGKELKGDIRRGFRSKRYAGNKTIYRDY